MNKCDVQSQATRKRFHREPTGRVSGVNSHVETWLLYRAGVEFGCDVSDVNILRVCEKYSPYLLP